jgi:hypothetical protein
MNNLFSAIGVTQDEYSVSVFNTGIEYLEMKANQWADDISQTTSFWSWWKHQWQIIDDVFLSKEKPLFGVIPADTLKAMWIEDHRACMRNKDIEAKIWKEFFEKMMHQSMKEVTRCA